MKFIRPKIELEIYEIPKDHKRSYWELFKKHHYLTDKLNVAARCYVGYWEGTPVAFESVITLPSGTMKNAWREHRLVVLCDYQGLGLGAAMCETIGEMLLRDGKRFFSKTANMKLGEYRNNSPKWKPTSKNGIRRDDCISQGLSRKWDPCKVEYAHRICYSHEYIGDKS